MLATTAFYESGRRDLTRPARSSTRDPDAVGWGGEGSGRQPHATRSGAELRHRVAITRGPGRRCRSSEPEDQPSDLRNSRQNSRKTRSANEQRKTLTAYAQHATPAGRLFMCATISDVARR